MLCHSCPVCRHLRLPSPTSRQSPCDRSEWHESMLCCHGCSVCRHLRLPSPTFRQSPCDCPMLHQSMLCRHTCSVCRHLRLPSPTSRQSLCDLAPPQISKAMFPSRLLHQCSSPCLATISRFQTLGYGFTTQLNVIKCREIPSGDGERSHQNDLVDRYQSIPRHRMK